MEKSKVYYCDMHTGRMNLPEKLKFLMKKAGFEDIDFTNKYAAIKIHFGEPGNLAYLRPNYAKVVCDYVKELGGKAFLTDCNTLYVGGRKNALDHLDSAYTNGYNPFQTGVHTIIADGLKGTDEELVPVNGEYVKEAKIGQAIMDADIVISLNHFKGHELTGFGKRIIVVVDLDKSWCDGFIIRVWRETGNPDIAYLQHTEKQTDTEIGRASCRERVFVHV